MTFEIILLAMVAAFLGMRLYSVLGKRTGHEQEPLIRKPLEERPAPSIRPAVPVIEQMPSASVVGESYVDSTAESGLRAIINADRVFDTGLFLEGAKSAYRLVLEAFWRGDREAIHFLCDDDVYQSFIEAIAAREEIGETLENRLVRIDKAQIIDARYEHPIARITVRFDADIAAKVKDKDGNIIGGSMSDAVEAHDIWTFMRDIKSSDRNWKLDETDEA